MTIEIRETKVYARWFTDLRDAQARGRILLAGGDKSTQQRDISRAIELAREL